MKRLVADLIYEGVLKTKVITDAFLAIDRKDFVLPEYKDEAYENYPLSLGYGQTISQPATVAIMLELLDPREGDKILDVGSGSGWTTALLGKIVGAKGKVIGVEIVPELVKFGRGNLAKYNFSWAKVRQSGKELGWSGEAPYDRILVSASSKELPWELFLQLKIGGIMVISVQDALWKIGKKSKNKIEKQVFPGFSFVPLKKIKP